MQLTVDSVKPTSTGKSLIVKAGGRDFFAKPASGIQAGMTIEVETKESQFNGKTNIWIEKWKPSNAAPLSASGDSLGGKSPVAGQAPSGAAPVWANFVSNQVAHAIQAGLITEPAHVKVWAAAAKTAFEELSK